MARVAITESYLEDIADAIREKTGLSEETYTPSEMAPAIMTISGSGGITPAGTININTNGTHNVTNYASANVSVPNSYSSSDEGKVVSNGALVAQSSATYTENGTYDTTLKNSVTVDVEGGGSSTEVVSVVDTTDIAGGTIRTITAVDISDTTATAADVASGKYFYTAAGVKTAGTGSGGSSDLSWLTSNTVTPSVRNFFYALINGTIEHGEFSLSDTPTSFVTAFTMTNFGESNLPQGIIIIDKDFYQGITTLANQSSEAFAFCWMDKAFTKPSDDSSDPPAYNAFRSMVNQNGTNASVGKITFDGSTASFRAKWQFSGNSLQVKHDYANNNQYCAFMRNRTYIWMAY